MSAASVTLPVHFVDATRDAIRAYSHGAASDAGGGRSSRSSSSSNAGSTASRRSSGSSLASNTSSAARKASSYRSRLSGSSVKAPVVETLYSGSASGRTTPSGQSLASTASTGSTQPSWLTKSNDWTTTGNSTDRSSVFSLGDWGEDEFDRAATRKVKSLFEDVDSWMFEQDNRVEGSLSQTSREECVEWVDKFIHCRTLGTQLLAPKDAVGYEMVSADAALMANRPATGSILIDVTENDEMTAAVPDLSAYSLCLSGKAMKTIEVAPSSFVGDGVGAGGGGAGGGSSSGSLRSDMSHLVEEIFEQDGKIEEYLAYDSRKFYSSSLVSSSSSAGGKLLSQRQQLQHFDSRSNYSKRRHYHHSHQHNHSQPPYRLEKSGLPPITPTGCLRDSIISGLFDLLWSSYITWIQHILQRYHASLVNEIVYKQLKSGVGLSSRSNHDHALLAKTGVDNTYNRLVMTTNLRRNQTADYGSERIGSGHAGGVVGGSGALSSQSSASSFITSVPVVGMVGVGLDSVVRPSSRLSTLTSRYTSFNVGQPDMTTLDGVLTISSKALHYQHKQQQQQQPPMTPSSHHRAASSLGTHGLHLQQQHPLYNHLESNNVNNGGNINANNNASSSKPFSGSALQPDDHLIHESLSSQTPIHVVHPNNSSSSLRGLISAAAPSPSFHHPRGQVTSIATISLTNNNNNNNSVNSGGNNPNSVVPSSSALGHNSRNYHNNFRSIESTPPSTSFLGGASARASAIGQRGRSRTHLQPLDRAKTPVISGGDENDPLAASSGGGGGLNVSNVSIGLEMVRGIGIVNSSSPPLGMPRNLPPLEADTNISNSRLGHHGGSSKRKNAVRASSAISDKNPRNVTSGTLKNRALRGIGTGREVGTPGGGGGGGGGDDRPNTTHTFRSDLVFIGEGGGGGGVTPSATNRRPLSPTDGTNRHSRSGSTATTSQPPIQQQQQINSNNTALGFGAVGQFEDKPIMLTGISLTPFNAHPLETMHHHHPSEEDEDIFVGGGGGGGTGLRSGIGEDSTWNQSQQNRVSKSPGSQRLTNSGMALKSRGRLGPYS